MAKLKAVRDSLDGVDEAIQALYTQGQDERFYLDMEGVDEHPTVLPALRKKDELLGEVKELKGRLKTFDGIDDPDAARKAIKRLPELEEAVKGGGKDAERIQQLQADHLAKLEQVQAAAQQQIEEANERAAKAESSVLDYYRRSEITKAITEAKGVPEFLEHIVAASVKVERDEDGHFKLQVLDAAGTPRVKDSKLTPMSVAEYVTELKQDPKYGRAFEPNGGGGSGASPNGSQGRGSANTVRAEGGMIKADPAKIVSGELSVAAQ